MPNRRPEILLIGGGGHCRSVIDVIEQENKYTIAGIIDRKRLVGTELLGYKVIGCDDNLPHLHKTYKHAVITVGQIRLNELRVKLFDMLKKIGYNLPVVISPLTYVSKHAFVDEGTVIMHQALINANAKIGKNCIINSKALIEHDAVIEDNCHISTAAIINGGTLIKTNSFVGSNVTTKEYVEVSGFTKAGSVVT